MTLTATVTRSVDLFRGPQLDLTVWTAGVFSGAVAGDGFGDDTMKDDELPNDLSPSEREWLLTLPPEERRSALEAVLKIRKRLRDTKPPPPDDDSDRRR